MKVTLPSLLCASLFFCSSSNAESWSYGSVQLIQTSSDLIRVRWDGPRTEICGTSNAVGFDSSSLGSEGAKRALSMVLTAATTGMPIRFHLNGCIGELQKAMDVQLCVKPDCTYQ